jgi:SPP1 family predicted phage head-tail adaptor
MAIGKRFPITFKALTLIDTPSGGATETFTAVLNTWATVKAVRSQINRDGSGLALADAYRFGEVRFDPDLVPNKKMLISYNGKDYTIQSILPDENNVPCYYTIIATLNE